MRRAVSFGILTALLVLSSARGARAGNNDDVIAGTDAALTGGAVVANVHTGAAMWFNPAGVARLDERSIGLTGAMYSLRIVNADGLLTLETGERSEGSQIASTVIPRALTFIMTPWDDVRIGIGFFNSRVDDIYLQETVVSEGTSPTSEWFSTTNSRTSLYHVSITPAWRLSPTLRLGGAFDIVIASRDSHRSLAGSYDQGAGGAFQASTAGSISAGGLQLKAGLQWEPHESVTFGISIATPSYMVYRYEDSTESTLSAPPTGSPTFEGTQVDEFTGTWAGVESGNLRAGLAYLFDRGWIEADLVYYFPLEAPEFGIAFNGVTNVRIGGTYELTPRLVLGAGFFTDRTQKSTPTSFGDSAIDYYGLTVGLDFANRAEAPGPDEDGFYLAFAIAVRYAHGTGEMGGVLIPATFQSSPLPVIPIETRVDELGVNLAVKFNF